jgi:hypothetical protein
MDGLNSYKGIKTRDTDIANTGNKGTNNLFKKPDSIIYMETQIKKPIKYNNFLKNNNNSENRQRAEKFGIKLFLEKSHKGTDKKEFPNQIKIMSEPKINSDIKQNLSILYSFFYCFSNMEYQSLLQLYKEQPSNKTIIKSLLFHFVAQSLKSLNKEKKYDLKPFYHKILEGNKIFEDNLGENAATEFIIFLMNQLHSDYKTIEKIQQTPLNEEMTQNYNEYINYYTKNGERKSIIFENYAWVNEKRIKCLSCNTLSKLYSHFFTYDLNLTSAINKIIFLKEETKYENKMDIEELDPNAQLTIRQLIKFNSENERLYNVYCSKCGQKCLKERESLIYSSSQYLIVLFSDIEKNSTIETLKEYDIKINIEKKLNIKDLKEDNTKNNNKYEINSIIFYNADSKKYISYLYRDTFKDWMIMSEISNKIENREDFLNVIDYKLIPVAIFYNRID